MRKSYTGSTLAALEVPRRSDTTHTIRGSTANGESSDLPRSLPHRVKSGIGAELRDGLWQILVQRITRLLLNITFLGAALSRCRPSSPGSFLIVLLER